MADSQEQVAKLKTPYKQQLTDLQDALTKLNNTDPIAEILAISRKLFVKYDSFKITRYINDWKCDRRFLSEKLILSENGLSLSVSASNGYPAVIGDIEFDTNLYAYEVIPEGLDCAGKEGFGIIEKDVYLAAQRNNPATPAVYTNMIGLFFRNEAKNMMVEKMSDLQMGSKYIVKVDMLNLLMTITGPELSLKAELKPDVVYTACFSCGCTSNKFKIRPLNDFYEA